MPLSTITSNSFSTTANTNIDNGLLFLDVINNRVGVGTATTLQKLTVDGNISLITGSNKFVRIGSGTNYSYDVMTANDDFQIREAELDNKVRLRIKYNATSSLAGQLQLPIDGGATLYNAYTCRAWVNFSGQGTISIRGSGNVSSITDGGVGIYTVNFTTAMPDANYAVAAGTADIGSGVGSMQTGTLSTGSFNFTLRYQDFTAYDWSRVFVTIFR
jgi:hypothetical protein